jgi:micrococcal nuclease
MTIDERGRSRRSTGLPSATRTLALALSLVTLTVHQLHVAGQPLDCNNFDSQIWAQTVYETNPAGYTALDPDGNGFVCEELPSGAAPAMWTSQVPSESQPVALIGVTDGDTIRVDVDGRNEPVRLILIDAPETHDPNNPPECFGQEATTYLSWLLSLGGDLYLETDVSDRDRFGRLLRYVWLDFGDGEVYLVNEALVRAGYAAFSTFPPDVKYVEEIREAGQFAREHGYGLWSGCITDEEGDTNEVSGGPGLDSGQQTDPGPTQSGAQSPAEQVTISDPASAFGCDPSYPDVCIPPLPPDLDCGDVAYRRFTVYPPDPHRFDGDYDGVGCEG